LLGGRGGSPKMLPNCAMAGSPASQASAIPPRTAQQTARTGGRGIGVPADDDAIGGFKGLG
jgi:hypothetical protein